MSSLQSDLSNKVIKRISKNFKICFNKKILTKEGKPASSYRQSTKVNSYNHKAYTLSLTATCYIPSRCLTLKLSVFCFLLYCQPSFMAQTYFCVAVCKSALSQFPRQKAIGIFLLGIWLLQKLNSLAKENLWYFNVLFSKIIFTMNTCLIFKSPTPSSQH